MIPIRSSTFGIREITHRKRRLNIPKKHKTEIWSKYNNATEISKAIKKNVKLKFRENFNQRNPRLSSLRECFAADFYFYNA